MSTLNDN